MALRSETSSALLLPVIPVLGCAHRHSGASLSGWIHTNDGSRRFDRKLAADVIFSRSSDVGRTNEDGYVGQSV